MVPLFTELDDLGGDCSSNPDFSIVISNLTNFSTQDDHLLGSSPQPLPALSQGGYWYTVHVSSYSSEQVQLTVSVPSSFPVECAGNVWAVSVSWTAEIH